MSIQSDLTNLGLAQVIVVLKPSTTASLGSGCEKYFTQSENSRGGALAAAAAAVANLRGGGHALEGAVAAFVAPKMRVYSHLGIALGSVDKAGYAGLKSSSAVESILPVPELSLIRPVDGVAIKLSGGLSWGLKRMRVPEVWERGFTGTGVIVGHLDTGIDGQHPALKKAIHAFAEFDLMGQQVVGAVPRDSSEHATEAAGHGTHTAGTIAGRAVGKSRFGVAPGCLLASALVIEGGDIVARILGGMNWIIGEGAKILSMSLGIRGYTEDFLSLMQIVRNRGVLPIIAVGNEGPGTSRSPGNYDICLSVGASNSLDEVADFSSSQRFIRPGDPLVPDLVGPGVGVISCLPGKRYGEMNGSSMATPHIAGLAALLWQAKPQATVDQIEAAIHQSCTRPASMPEARANRGVPDAVKALAALVSPGPVSLVAKKKPPSPQPTAVKKAKKAKPKKT